MGKEQQQLDGAICHANWPPYAPKSVKTRASDLRQEPEVQNLASCKSNDTVRRVPALQNKHSLAASDMNRAG